MQVLSVRMYFRVVSQISQVFGGEHFRQPFEQVWRVLVIR